MDQDMTANSCCATGRDAGEVLAALGDTLRGDPTVLSDRGFVHRVRQELTAARRQLEGGAVTGWMDEQETAYANCVAAGAYDDDFLDAVRDQVVSAVVLAAGRDRGQTLGDVRGQVRYLWDRMVMLDLALVRGGAVHAPGCCMAADGRTEVAA